MSKKIIFSLLMSVFYFTLSYAVDETLTITTYYPSPYGSYNSLQAYQLGVGDNTGTNGLTAADVPTTQGDVWIAGKVGIGTGTAALTEKLEVNGTIKATAYQASGLTGISGTATVMKTPTTTCTVTITNGIVTASTC